MFKQNKNKSSAHDIAVIGMACRFPGAQNYQQFWQNLEQGVFSVTQIPSDRWDVELYYSLDGKDNNKAVTKWGGFINDIDKFDAPFFKISPREAQLMDPQQRIMLELAHTCMEDAGYNPSQLKGSSTAVYIGACNYDYKEIHERSMSNIEGHISTGLYLTLIPNRISYTYDFKGPSLLLDTACSSALMAMNEAVNALRQGDCEQAFVGGVSILSSPTYFVAFSKSGMLSPNGMCRTFDNSADGYVRAEGAAMILIKPLQQAQNDHDNIHAVIKGISANHGGKVATITSPNPFSQSQVIVQAMENANIDITDINYIEAHGTATPKGDPIEINGLKRAFATMAKLQGKTLEAGHCGIGSVKTNIGHLEAVSGLAGFIKICMAMKHQTLPALAHFEQLNSRIKIDNSPLYIVDKKQPWQGGSDGLRRAGVSSFGFGGVNAHVVLEQYLPDKPIEYTQFTQRLSQPLVFTLSAKNQETLIRYAKLLADDLNQYTKVDDGQIPYSLADFVHTIQQRELMEQRLAIIVDSFAQLYDNLQLFVNQHSTEIIFNGNAKQINEQQQQPNQDDIKDWFSNKQLDKVASYWCQGGQIADWSLQYPDAKVPSDKLRLPTYPFSKRRYWIEDSQHVVELKHQPSSSKQTTAQFIHPMLHQNHSTLFEQKFSSAFCGDEFFLNDHKINGVKVLPGVAYLEMAIAAMSYSMGQPNLTVSQPIEITDVVWLRPLSIEQSTDKLKLEVTITPEQTEQAQQGYLAFEVFNANPEQSDAQVSINAQGKIRLAQTTSMTNTSQQNQLNTIKQRLEQLPQDAQDIYREFKAIGFDYGVAHQGIEQIYASSNEILAKLTLPQQLQISPSPYLLHPCLIDSALQASMLFDWRNPSVDNPKLFLPFSLQKLTIAADFSHHNVLWAWIHPSEHQPSNHPSSLAKSFDIDLYDEQGKLCIQLQGLTLRAAIDNHKNLPTPDPQQTSVVLAKPAWSALELSEKIANEQINWSQHQVLLAGLFSKASAKLQSSLEKSSKAQTSIEYHLLEGAELSLIEQFETQAMALFQQIKQLLTNKATNLTSDGRILLQVVIANTQSQHIHAALSGLLKTAQQEHSKLVTQLLLIDEALAADRLDELVKTSAQMPQHQIISYHQGNDKQLVAQRHLFETLSVFERPNALDKSQSYFTEGGVYLITGGIGGLGRIFATEIARQLKQGTVILTGRSPLDQDKTALLSQLNEDAGAVNIHYRQMDVVNAQVVSQTISDIVQEFGGLNGIIHSAGIVEDNYIVKKTVAEFRQVLAPKLAGTINLDEASKDLQLEFFVLFSSTSAALGNVGQTDYATANAFMDQFAAYRHELSQNDKKRSGKSLSINWPLWSSGGMQVHESTATMLKEKTGMVPLESQLGLAAFYAALASSEHQIVVIQGLAQKIINTLSNPIQLKPLQAKQPQSSQYQTQISLPKLQNYLLDCAAQLLKLEVSELDTTTELADYGFDSITLTELSIELSESLDIDLDPTLFFDYATIEGLANHLTTTCAAQLIAADIDLTTADSLADKPTNSADEQSIKKTIKQTKPIISKFTPTQSSTQASAQQNPIAIIGVSGVLPMAENIDEFWQNLEQGKNCIREVPAQRWDWQAIWGDPSGEDNSSDVKWGGFIDDMDVFDPTFFGISPREVLAMDPQQRMLLTHSWAVIEDAGYAPSSLSGANIGVFIGIVASGYDQVASQSGQPITGSSTIGTIPSIGPNRVSYFFNFHGPSEPIETACSSSLIAIHRGVTAMNVGDCEQAIVGGVNLIPNDYFHISFNNAGMLSADGSCKTFSKDANGYVRGEGLGLLMLKKLTAAQNDGDHIYGLICGSAQNHGGRANSLTAPNSLRQSELLIKAYQKANIDPRTITYIETHGTGTQLGDPIEINGIKAAFQSLYDMKQDTQVQTPHCALGAVKTVIGHLEVAAGIAGVIKVLLQFKHQKIVKNLHFNELNPYIDLKDTPFYLSDRCHDWVALTDTQGRTIPRRAGVSAFGFGGANAHVVLEEYPQPKIEAAPITAQLVLLSAKSELGLTTAAQNLLNFIDQQQANSLCLTNLAYTLQVGRDAMDERLAMVVESIDSLKDKLQAFINNQAASDLYVGQVSQNKDMIATLGDSSELQQTMQNWLDNKQFSRFLGLWSKGVNFDWQQYYRNQKEPLVTPKRISLPTYPFERKQFWPSPQIAKQAQQKQPNDQQLKQEVAQELDDPILQTLRQLEQGTVDLDAALSALD